MPDTWPDFRFAATGIGSVPFLDIEPTCQKIAGWVPVMPFWPQFVQRSYLEDMIVQYTEGLPLLEADVEQRSLTLSRSKSRESELVLFYERFLGQDIDAFAISREYACGLYAFLELVQESVELPVHIKGQTVGPVTFAAAIKDLNGKSILYDSELSDAMTQGLAIKALWQVKKLSGLGKRPVIFLDEPYLSGFGSAFSPIQRQEVIDMLRMVIDYLRGNSDVIIGIHCCGNTDWSMICEAGPDIINFDAAEYMEHFLLYQDDIMRFIEGRGVIAWGIVPTAGFTGEETLETLASQLKQGLKRLQQWGLDYEQIARQSILTPACGLGSMHVGVATRVMELLSGLSEKCKTWDRNTFEDG